MNVFHPVINTHRFQVCQNFPSFPGKLLEEEISNLKNLILSNNEQNVAVLGGAKISTKLKIIEFYAKNYSRVLVEEL